MTDLRYDQAFLIRTQETELQCMSDTARPVNRSKVRHCQSYRTGSICMSISIERLLVEVASYYGYMNMICWFFTSSIQSSSRGSAASILTHSLPVARTLLDTLLVRHIEVS